MKDETKKVIGSKLKLLRIENADTIETLAAKAKLSISTISRYENGSDMTISNVVRILNCYDMDIGIFFDNVSAKMHEIKEKR